MENRVLDSLLLEKKEKIKGRLYHYTQIHMAYNSNHIEGSKLTEEQTRLIFETASFFSNGNEIMSQPHDVLFLHLYHTIPVHTMH